MVRLSVKLYGLNSGMPIIHRGTTQIGVSTAHWFWFRVMAAHCIPRASCHCLLLLALPLIVANHSLVLAACQHFHLPFIIIPWCLISLLWALFPAHFFIISITFHACIVYHQQYNLQYKKKKGQCHTLKMSMQHWPFHPLHWTGGSEYDEGVWWGHLKGHPCSEFHQHQAQPCTWSCGCTCFINTAGATSITTKAALVAIIAVHGKQNVGGDVAPLAVTFFKEMLWVYRKKS